MARVAALLRADPVVMAALRGLARAGPPDGWLVAGALYGAVWNALTGRPAGHGLTDLDVIWFDPADLSAAAEREVEAAQRKTLGALAQGRNQARVHLWFPARFGIAYPPLTSALESLARYPFHAQALAARLDGAALRLVAPFGVDDLLALRMTPNLALANRAAYDRKAARILRRWPEVRVTPWPEGGMR